MTLMPGAGEEMTPAKKAAKKSAKKAVKNSAVKKTTNTKADKAKAAAKSAATLHKAGLIDQETMSDDHRKKLSKLKPEEVKALVAAKKKMGFTGKLNGPGADFF